MRLLFVEDDPRIAEPTLIALREAGYAVTWAQTGPEGLEAAALGEFPLVVLDVMLPDVSGYQIVQDVRADRAAGIGSVATVLGARPVVVVAIALYVLSAGLVAFGPWPSVFAVPLPLLYAALVALILAGVMFPLWPRPLRVGVWYLRLGVLGLVGLLLVIALG